ncbi:hypothetical protein PIROE2DRAFT_66965 [Piromyces sp. E2]|nr:hypothetical protein PIROE2DRAFT_66965 [Piromyces sp. E2]|eukprot:OUM68086.1 hypothetical protein PIROE2DRAFT_66965 [Piromyces sp. E2]
MIKDEVQNLTKKSIELMAQYAVEAFNNNYNLDLNVNQILENISDKNTTKKDSNDNEDDDITVLMENLCIATKRDGNKCNKKIKGKNLLCGNHKLLKATLPLSQYVDIVAREKKYEIKPKIISIGNNWAEDTVMDKWPQIITVTNTNFFKGYVMFFTEYENYTGAGIFVVQNISPLKKNSHCIATHYVEVNNYCESMGGKMFIKMTFTQINKFENKPIYNRITDLLNSYDITYDLFEVCRGIKDHTNSNPIVIVNKINDILKKHNNVMYFHKDNYTKYCIENESSDSE